MSDEIRDNDRTTNDDTSSSSHQDNDEIQQTKSSLNENNSHLNNESIQNGDHNEDLSSNQESIEENPLNNNSNDDQRPTSPSHIEPVNTLNEQNTFQESNINNNQDDSNISFIDDETPKSDTNLNTQTSHNDKPDELKAQRELDDNEYPPVESPTLHHETNDTSIEPEITSHEDYHNENENSSINSSPDETSADHQINNSSTELETNINDNRPLTELETPYEHHHHDENEISSNDLSTNEISTHIESNDNLIDTKTLDEYNDENVINNDSSPDTINETFEENDNNFVSETIELEKPSIEENLNQNEVHFTEEDFPPLSSTTTNTFEQKPLFENNLNQNKIHLTEEDFPPLPTTTIDTSEQILHTESNDLNKQEQHPLFRNNKTMLAEPKDILGNKTLFKQTIVEGTPNTYPTRSTMATVSYTLSLIDNLTSNTRIIENVSNEKFFISECDTIPAIDICVQSMNRGERALIDSDVRHCYGDSGCEEKQIPPITSINSYKMKIDLELHDWQNSPDIQQLSIEDRLYWGNKKQQMGNFYYRRQDFLTSIQCYNGALRFFDTDNNPILVIYDEKQRIMLNDRYVQVQNNLAQVNLLLNKYDACLKSVENVFKYDPKNIKALFRQGKALFELGKYDKAIQSLKTFIQVQKGNSTSTVDQDKAYEMISICENKLAHYEKNEKEIYRRMFQPSTTTSTVNQRQQTKNTNKSGNTNNNWWPYIALGSAVVAIGIFTFIKYRKVS